MNEINKHISKLKKDGITFIKDVLTHEECTNYVKKSNIILNKLLKKKTISTLNSSAQNIPNPFSYDKDFFKLIYFKKLDKILSYLLDKDYVLTNTSLVNRRIFKHKLCKGINVGKTWHVDTHYLGTGEILGRGKKLNKGFSYQIILMLEDFKEGNGSTLYIPGSHLYRKKPKRNGKYKYKAMTGKKGSMVIFDSGLWHRGGKPSNESRWSIFSYYVPWFVKPYYRFEDMIGKNKMKKLDKQIRKLLHYNSTPPISAHERANTVTKM